MEHNARRPETMAKHLTKAEIETRTKGEAALKTDRHLMVSEAVKNDPLAYKYFKRIVASYNDIGMNESFFENCINRYCLLLAENDRITQQIRILTDTEEADADTLKMVISLESKVGKIRDQLLSIEKDNLLTVNSKLRAVPKKPEVVEVSPLEAFKQRYSS